MNNLTEKILSSIRIENYISELIHLDDGNKAVCPFHKEKTASLSVNIKDQYYHCFGCGSGGDIITFAMQYHQMTFYEAMKHLSSKYNLPNDTINDNPQEENTINIQNTLAKCAVIYHQNLPPEVLRYLNLRGLSNDIIYNYKIGFCDKNISHNIDKSELIKAGLQTEKGAYFFDGYITFPHIFQGKTIYISARGYPDKKHKKLNKDNVKLNRLFNEEAVRRKEVVIAEGEIDTLTLIDNGFDACGVLGSSSFPEDWRSKFNHCETVYICFDADEAGIKGSLNVADVIGDKARIVTLPVETGINDINDYFKKYTADDFRKLLDESASLIEYKINQIPQNTPKIKLPDILAPIIKELSKINEIKADAILKYKIKDHFSFTENELKQYQKMIKQYRKQTDEEPHNKSLTQDKIIDILKNNADSQSIHPAQDYKNGIMNFAVIIKNQSYIVNSNKEIIPLHKVIESGDTLKTDSVDQSNFSYRAITDFIENQPDPKLSEIYITINSYIKRFIVLPDESYLCLLSLWIIGTYFFMIFRYYPYIWLNAEKSSGKTLLMEVISAIAFNGELITNPTEAVIFRDISNNLITMFIDEVEQLRKRDKDVYGSLISLLNTGFNKSGNVKRTESTGKGGFVVKSYSSYSPKMFAGINDIDDVLQDRTIRIPLLRKKDSEHTQRYKQTAEIIKIQKGIRDSLYIFALNNGNQIAELYHKEGQDGIEGLSHLSNRELDIWEPIFLTANIIDAQYDLGLTAMMETLSKTIMNEKQSENITANETFKVLSVVKSMINDLPPISSDNQQHHYEAEKVLEFFKKTEEFEWIDKTNKLTRMFKKVSIKSEQQRFGAERKRIYIIDIKKINDLFERFKI